jgi:hypothetical protein
MSFSPSRNAAFRNLSEVRPNAATNELQLVRIMHILALQIYRFGASAKPQCIGSRIVAAREFPPVNEHPAQQLSARRAVASFFRQGLPLT